MSYEIEFRPIKLLPESWAQRDEYLRSPFEASYTQTMRLLDRELTMLGASNVVLQVQARASQINRDGRLRADARLDGPGLILSFDSAEHGTLTYDTDRFVHWHDNLRAIALGLESLRRVERYGIADRGQQYAGYRELGTGIALGPGAMTADVAAKLIADALDDPHLGSFEVLQTWGERRKMTWRALCRVHHPDKGGDPALFQQLTEAVSVLDKGVES